jgi:hypothetical protein
LALPWATSEAEREPVCDQHGVGQASTPKGPVSDLQMAGQASELPRSTGPAECWLSDSVITQARNRLLCILMASEWELVIRSRWKKGGLILIEETTTCQI